MTGPLRIAFVGSCQVHGLKETAIKLMPEAVIEAYNVGASNDDAEICSLVSGFDSVITQIETSAENDLLSAQALTGAVKQVLYLPIFGFTGLHPDMTYAMKDGKVFKGPSSDTHSLLAITGHLIGLDERRIEKLFNAHVFSELGYFDNFHVARLLLKQESERTGYDLTSGVDDLISSGKRFMHTFNHPTIEMLSRLCRDVLARAGHVPPDIPVPTEVVDNLVSSLVAPILPPLARRFNLEGGTTYLRPIFSAGEREMPLKQVIAESLELYRATDMTDVYFPRRAEMVPALERLLKT